MAETPEADPARLAQQNALLSRQVKLLIRTEQRLHRAQRQANDQLRRIETLNRLALTTAASHDAREIVRLGLVALLDLFPFEQAVAFLPDADGELCAAVCTAGAGCRASRRPGPADSRWPLPPGTALVGAPRELAESEADADPVLSVAVAYIRAHFESDGSSGPGAGQVLTLPVARVDGSLAALLVLRRPARPLSHAELLAGGPDLPFLSLVASHLQVALTNARLFAGQQRAEAEVARSEARLRTILEELPDAIVVIRAGNISYLNAAATRCFASPAEVLVGTAYLDLVHPQERAAARAAIASLRPGEPMRVLERRMLRPSGEVVLAEEVMLALELDDGPAVLVIAVDLTERRAMRSQLLQAERLASVGALAAGVAHEINNPLAYLVLHLERLVGKLGDEELAASAQLALDGSRRIADIVRDLKTFARADEEVIEAVDIASLVTTVLAMAGNQLRHRARVINEVPAGLTVQGSRSRLGQVFLNLIINAAQAIPEGAADQHVVRIDAQSSGELIQIGVSDTGSGIAPSALARIFEPFFTTKEGGDGLGLGLAISHNIVQCFGGHIEVTSELGRGSRFLVCLPRTDEVAPPPAASSDEVARPVALRLLVVDDEPHILGAISYLLEDCDVVTAPSGREALRILESDRRFDVVLCDLMMPVVAGPDVHAWLAREAPELAARLVFMTGGSFTARGSEFLAGTDRPVLAKPFSGDDLTAVLRAVVDEHGA